MNNIISILVNNLEFEVWTSVSIQKSLETLSGSFNITLTQKFNQDGSIIVIPINTGDAIKVLIDKEKVIDGYIDSRSISYSNDSHNIQISGRDKTCDIIDSSLSGNSNLNSPYTATQLVNHILTRLNITNIKVINKLTEDPSYELNFEVGRGENAWGVLDKYLQKKSIFATSNSDGNIVLFRGNFGTTQYGLRHTLENNQLNNILSGESTNNIQNRYNTISVISQSESIVSDGNFHNQGGEDFKAIDKTIRETRKLEVVADTSLNSEECNNLAKFNVNIRQARGVGYNYTVRGYRQSENGNLWMPNYLVHVIDDSFGINSLLLIKSVEYTKDNSGSLTKINLVDKYAYSLREPIAIEQ
jgi:prophage tail gpP-like protein